MLTIEQINTFQELHNQLGNKGFLYQFTHGSYGTEFFSVVEHEASKAIISKSLIDVKSKESQVQLEAYRKLLINLIETA